MKVLSTDGLTKLIELIKGAFISVDDTVTTSTVTLPTVNNATITVQKNGTTVDSFTANQSTNKTINITVPTTASDVNALPSTTKYGATIDVTLSTTDYKQTITLKDQDGNTLNSKVVDFPVESMVVSGTFDSTNKKIVLTLQNGNTTDIPVGDLISGLQTEITSTNKLSADLIADGTTNKVVTATEKSTWNSKLDSSAISDMATKTWVGNQGYTSNVGTVTSVNNAQPDASGNVTITIPDSATWGNITGTLSNQTDLQNALNSKTLVTFRDWSVA